MADVKNAIPDPRGDHSFGCNEECFATVEKQVSCDEALEHFPLKYSKFTKSQALLKSSARTVVKLHPELFVVIDNEAPAKEGVIIARLFWDKNTGRPEQELRRAGRESCVETQRCDVVSLVETLQRMADGSNT